MILLWWRAGAAKKPPVSGGGPPPPRRRFIWDVFHGGTFVQRSSSTPAPVKQDVVVRVIVEEPPSERAARQVVRKVAARIAAMPPLTLVGVNPLIWTTRETDASKAVEEGYTLAVKHRLAAEAEWEQRVRDRRDEEERVVAAILEELLEDLDA